MLAIVVALYNTAGLTSPTLLAKGVKKWLVSHADREGAVVARTTGAIEGAV
jgi:hypothetical protein